MERVELHREGNLYYACPEYVGDVENDAGRDFTCGSRYGIGQFESNRTSTSGQTDWRESLPDGITIWRHHCHMHMRKRLFTPFRVNILPIRIDSYAFENERKTFIKQNDGTSCIRKSDLQKQQSNQN